MRLKFMEQQPLDPTGVSCPSCQEDRRIGIHSHTERRYSCHQCGTTFAETKGTVFYGLHYPIWVVVLASTLLAHGCPVVAIVAAFAIDERTVLRWLDQLGLHGKAVQEPFVCQGQVEFGQVQLDELCVTVQGGKVWVATAMSVFSRLCLWGEVSTRRDKGLVEGGVMKVKQAASSTTPAILFAVDGLAAYPKAILNIFHPNLYTGRQGRPRHLPWPNLHIVQVIKSRSGQKLKEVTRTWVYGNLQQAYDIIQLTHVGLGQINTAFIERLNGTFRSRMPSFVRRTRHVARMPTRLEREMFWSGSVYNVCTRHRTVEGTPAMAAGLTETVWSVEQLLRLKLPNP